MSTFNEIANHKRYNMSTFNEIANHKRYEYVNC